MQVFGRPLLSSRIPYKLNLRRLWKYLGPIRICHLSTPLSFKQRDVPFYTVMPSSSRRPFSPDVISMSPTYSSDSLSKPATPLLNVDNLAGFPSIDADQMLFGPLEFDDYASSSPAGHVSWDPFNDMEYDVKPRFDFSASSSSMMSAYEYDIPQMSPADSGFFDGGHVDINLVKSSPHIDNMFLANWINDPDLSLSSPSSPISIPSPPPPQSPSFVPYTDQSHFPRGATFSPTEFAALHPLPRSITPPSSFEERPHMPRQRVHSISPLDTRLHTPSWASQLFDSSGSLRPPSSSRTAVRHSPLSDSTMRQRVPVRTASVSSGQIFQSSSAPSVFEPRVPPMTRAYSRRAESESVNDDYDATIRRKKRTPPIEEPSSTVKNNDSRQFLVIVLPNLASN